MVEHNEKDDKRKTEKRTGAEGDSANCTEKRGDEVGIRREPRMTGRA